VLKNLRVRKLTQQILDNKKSISIIIIITAISILSLVVTSQTVNKETKKLWYDVSDWEINACSRWGGRTTTQQSETTLQPQTYGDITITVQGKKHNAIKQTLYEVTYYIQSHTATTEYLLQLKNPTTGKTKEISRGNLAPESGITDYWAETLPEDYTIVSLTYYKGTLTAPIIEAQ